MPDLDDAPLPDERQALDDATSREFFLRTRKEAIVAGLIWCVFFVWVVGLSFSLGYGTVDPADTISGFPTWIFWGVFVPFVVATAVNCLYSLAYLKDDDEKL